MLPYFSESSWERLEKQTILLMYRFQRAGIVVILWAYQEKGKILQ